MVQFEYHVVYKISTTVQYGIPAWCTLGTTVHYVYTMLIPQCSMVQFEYYVVHKISTTVRYGIPAWCTLGTTVHHVYTMLIVNTTV